jgi:hypothetical protein
MNAHLLGNLFALLVSLAGWFYLFNGRHARALGLIEGAAQNDRRIRLRRVGGFLMLLCSACLFGGNNLDDLRLALACWLAVLMLLLGIIVLALLDLRLTMKLRKRS